MSKTSAPALSRRNVFAGAGAVGAMAAAAALLPRAAQPTAVAGAREKDAKDASAGGYRLTDHVLRYYQTTKV